MRSVYKLWFLSASIVTIWFLLVIFLLIMLMNVYKKLIKSTLSIKLESSVLLKSNGC